MCVFVRVHMYTYILYAKDHNPLTPLLRIMNQTPDEFDLFDEVEDSVITSSLP